MKKVDLEFVNVIENIDMNRPRRIDFMTHSDRFYLSVRLSFVDKAIKEIKRRSNIRLVSRRKINEQK